MHRLGSRVYGLGSKTNKGRFRGLKKRSVFYGFIRITQGLRVVKLQPIF